MSTRLHRRAALKLGAVLAVSPVLAACAAQPAAPTQGPAPTPQVITKEVTKEVPVTQVVEKQVTQVVEKQVTQVVEKIVTTAPQPLKRTEIRVSHWWGETFKKSLILEAARDMPELLIKEETTPWGEYHTKLLTQLAGGVAPDAFLQDSTFNGQFFPAGVELALNDYLKTSGLEPAKWSIPLDKETTFKGKTYGLPQFYSEQFVVSFNAEMVDKEGIKLPLPGTPDFDTWKWDKLVEVLTALTKRTSDGKVEQWGLGQNWDGFNWPHQCILAQNGGKLFDSADHYGETEIFLNSPENTQVLQALYDLTAKHKVTPVGTEAQAIQGGPFQAKKAAAYMYQGMACCNKDFPFHFVTIAMPYFKAPGRIYGGNHWALNPSSKLRDDGWKWIMYSTTNKHGLDASGFSTWQAIADYDSFYYLDEMKAGDIKQAYEAWFRRNYAFEIPRWLGEKAPAQVQKIANDEMNLVYQGKIAVPEALAAAKAQIDPLLKKQ